VRSSRSPKSVVCITATSDTRRSPTSAPLPRHRPTTPRIDVVPFVPPLTRCELEVMDQRGSWGRVPDVEAAEPRRGTLLGLRGIREAGRHGVALPRGRARLAGRGPHEAPPVSGVGVRPVRRLGRDYPGRRCGGGPVDRRRHFGRQETARTAVQRQGNRCARVRGEMLHKRGGTAATQAGSGSEPVRR
jgi:hypothetical protein